MNNSLIPDQGIHKGDSLKEFKIFYGYQFVSIHFDPDVLREIMKIACEQAMQRIEGKVGKYIISPTQLEPSVGGTLLGELKSAIEDAVMCVFEVSDRNPNVFLEAGYAIGLGKRAGILIDAEIQDQIPSDIKGVVYLPYSRNNPMRVVEKLSAVIADEVLNYIESRPLSQWFWEKITSSPANVFLGRTTEDNFSWGDVVAMDILRTHLQKQEMLSLNLTSDVQGNVLEQQVISIGGPRRNKITESILNFVSNNVRYCFIDTAILTKKDPVYSKLESEIKKLQLDTQVDPYIIYDKHSGKIYATELNFKAAGETDDPGDKKKLTTGKDYGIVYRIVNPYSPEVCWTIFTGISRAGTLACLETMVNTDILRKIRSELRNDDVDVEILFETQIVNGRSIGAIPIEWHELTLDKLFKESQHSSD